MNQYAYEHGICPDKTLFYDGNSCYQVFTELAVVPCGSKSNNESNVNNDQKKKSCANTSNASNANKSYSNRNFELQSYIAKALAVYRESVDKYWADKYPEVAI